MEWIGIVIVAIILVAAAFKALRDIAAFLGKIAAWIIGPKEWFGSLLLRGSFRPRVHTVLILLLTLLVTSALLLVVLLTAHSEWLGTALMCAALFLPLGTKKLWSYLRKREHIAVQVKRDKRAHQFKGSLASRNTPPDFSLYLRPFESTKNIEVETFHSITEFKHPAWRKTLTDYHEKTEDLETLLAIALDSYAPLVALGRPGEQVGAGRILTTEERWQEDFRKLANAARLILLMPSSRPGTAWELDSVLNDSKLLSKTVFLIPPSIGNPEIHWESIESFGACAGIGGSRNRNSARSEGHSRKSGLKPRVPVLSHSTFSPRIDSFSISRSAYYPSLPSSDREQAAIGTSGLVFRWDRSTRDITFSAPLIVYAQPSPLRFLVDLWFSRETVVLSLWRLKRNLLRVVECDSRVKNPSAATILLAQ